MNFLMNEYPAPVARMNTERGGAGRAPPLQGIIIAMVRIIS